MANRFDIKRWVIAIGGNISGTLQELTFMAKLANQKILFLDLLLISLRALHIMMELLQFIL